MSFRRSSWENGRGPNEKSIHKPYRITQNSRTVCLDFSLRPNDKAIGLIQGIENVITVVKLMHMPKTSFLAFHQ